MKHFALNFHFKSYIKFRKIHAKLRTLHQVLKRLHQIIFFHKIRKILREKFLSKTRNILPQTDGTFGLPYKHI